MITSRRIWARLAWGCLLALGGILPGVFWTRTDDTVRTPQWVFFCIVAAIGVAAHLAAGLPVLPRRHPLRAPLLAVAAAAILLPLTAFRAAAAVADGLGVLAGVGVAGLAAHWLRSARRRSTMLAVLVIAHVGVAAYGFAQYLGMDPMRWAYQYGGARPFSTLGNPNFLAGHFAMLLPLAAGLLLAAADPLAKAGWFLLALAWALLVLVSQTRSAWIATVVSLAWLGWQARGAALGTSSPGRGAALASAGREWMAAQRIWIAAFIVVVGGIGLSAAIRNPALAERVGDILPHDFGQVAKRFSSAKVALLTWKEFPVFGFGPGCFTHAFGRHLAEAIPESARAQYTHTYSEEYAHNDYLQLVSESGAVGFGLFAWLAVGVLRLLLTAPDDESWTARLVLAGGIAIGIHGGLNLPFHIAPTAALIWMAVGLAAALRPVSAEEGAALCFGSEGPGPAVLYPAWITAAVVGVMGAAIFASSLYSRVGKDCVNFQAWSKLREAYGNSMKLDWNDRREGFYVGSALSQMGDYDGSVKVFERELVRNPYYMDGWANCGAVYGLQGKIADAERVLKRAIELNPSYAEAYANLGVAYLQEKRWLEAADMFRKAQELEPSLGLSNTGLEMALARRKP